MSKKSLLPPPRPPAPKLGGSGGMSFSFKALEEESDEELTVFTGKFDKQVHDEKEKHSRDLIKERSSSKSPDTKLAETGTTPMPVRHQNSFDKLIDIKEKIHDTIKTKIEEFSSDNQSKSGKEKENEVKTTKDIADNTNDLGVDEKQVHKIKGPASLEPDINYVDVQSDYFDTSTEPKLQHENHKTDEAFNDADELDINEDYYNPDVEDFSELPGVVPMLRQRKRFQKSGKIKPLIPPAPISMSKLSQKMQDKQNSEGKEVANADKIEITKNTTTEERTITIQGTKIPVRKLCGCVIFFFLYMLLPLPSYIRGVIAGCLLSSVGWMLYLWMNQLPKQRESIPEDPPLDKLPPLPVPEMKEPKGEDCLYKSWMNECLEYTPDNYSINQTHSVFVHLEGTTLRLRRPKVGVPKRAMWDEPNPTPQFIHQRHFDIEGSKILLLPPELVKKRLWSKKYPICIALANAGHNVKYENQPNIGSQSSSGGTGNQTSGKMSTSSSSDSVMGFECVSEQKCDTSVLYLFARTCHEKEQWFKRFEAAAKGKPLKNHILEIRRILNSSTRHRRSSSSDSLKNKRQNSSDSVSSLGTNSPSMDDVQSSENDLRNFVMFMSRLIPHDKDASLPSSPAHAGGLKDRQDNKNGDSKVNVGAIPRGIVCDPSLIPVNALLGRCFWDFLRDKYWAEKVKDKLQKKLSKIHIPYFIEQLKISNIDLGTEVPVIRRANKPFLDENGFWVDLDLTYSGKFKMTIETKVNLLKLKSTKSHSEKSEEEKKSAITDSDEEDSAESSTDEEEETSAVSEDGAAQAGGTGKKIMKYITKITASKYFQSATENKYIKKAMTEVSNTPLILTVEVLKLNGTMAINIPPLPSDRLWYGFRGNPQLWLVAKPKVGEREVTMSHITDWIEKKLALEFQHVLVMPNMDDFIIPILLPGSVAEAFTKLPQTQSGSEV